MIEDYENIPFIKEDGTMDLLTCPKRNSRWLFENGMKNDDSYQEIHGVAIYPIEYFSPLDSWSGRMWSSENTYSIHHCEATWNPKESRIKRNIRFFGYKMRSVGDFILHIPHRSLKRILGLNGYNKLIRFLGIR